MIIGPLSDVFDSCIMNAGNMVAGFTLRTWLYRRPHSLSVSVTWVALRLSQKEGFSPLYVAYKPKDVGQLKMEEGLSVEVDLSGQSWFVSSCRWGVSRVGLGIVSIWTSLVQVSRFDSDSQRFLIPVEVCAIRNCIWIYWSSNSS